MAFRYFGKRYHAAVAFAFGLSLNSALFFSSSPSLADPLPLPVSELTSQAQEPLGLREFAAAWNSLTNYTATINLFERKEQRTEKLLIYYSFRKPTTVEARIVAGTKPGAILTWDGGTTLVARRNSGFASLFKKKFSLDDPTVATVRGSSIDELSFGAMLIHLQNASGSLTGLPESRAVGANSILVYVPRDPATDAGLTREIYVLSVTTHLPIRVLGYTGVTVVRDIVFSNVVFEATSPSVRLQVP